VAAAQPGGAGVAASLWRGCGVAGRCPPDQDAVTAASRHPERGGAAAAHQDQVGGSDGRHPERGGAVVLVERNVAVAAEPCGDPGRGRVQRAGPSGPRLDWDGVVVLAERHVAAAAEPCGGRCSGRVPRAGPSGPGPRPGWDGAVALAERRVAVAAGRCGGRCSGRVPRAGPPGPGPRPGWRGAVVLPGHQGWAGAVVPPGHRDWDGVVAPAGHRDWAGVVAPAERHVAAAARPSWGPGRGRVPRAGPSGPGPRPGWDGAAATGELPGRAPGQPSRVGGPGYAASSGRSEGTCCSRLRQTNAATVMTRNISVGIQP
jgi:hypothetical protein